MALSELEELNLLEQLEVPGLSEVDELAILEQLDAGEIAPQPTATLPAVPEEEQFNLRNLARQQRERQQQQQPEGRTVTDPITGEPRQIAGVGAGGVAAFETFVEPAITVGTAAASEVAA